jgi:hypothetical protein
MRGFIVFCLGLISTMYLLNVGAGFIELIPDNIPIVGNLDEAGAAALLIMCLGYFGIDLTNIFKKKPNKNNIPDK